MKENVVCVTVRDSGCGMDKETAESKSKCNSNKARKKMLWEYRFLSDFDRKNEFVRQSGRMG